MAKAVFFFFNSWINSGFHAARVVFVGSLKKSSCEQGQVPATKVFSDKIPQLGPLALS